jgi:MFS family permease
MSSPTEKLYTKQFILLCTSFALFGGSFNMMIPELPAFLSEMGGEDYKGFIISLFTLTAGLSRPISGKLADHIGRMPVIAVGAVVCIICSSLYPLLSTVSMFLMLRLMHGFSTGFTPTAISAYVADIAPIARRGEAMGIIGVSINIGSSMTPPIGSWIANEFSLMAMFYASSLTALISVLLVMRMRETLPNPQRLQLIHFKLKRSEIIDPVSLVPAIIAGLTFFGLGALLTIVADQADYLGMNNKGLFFTSFTLCSVLSRLVAGQVSDRYGRKLVISVAMVLVAVSYVILGTADSTADILIATGAIGFSIGVASPSIFAWVIDRSDDARRGTAMATVYLFLEFFIGGGALFSAFVYDNDPANFDMVFYLIAMITLSSLVFLQLSDREG